MSCTDAVRYAKDRQLYYSDVDNWCARVVCMQWLRNNPSCVSFARGRYRLEQLPTAWTNNLLCRAFLLLYRYIRGDEACVSNVISVSIGKFAHLHLYCCTKA
jgi:hypothetical protein